MRIRDLNDPTNELSVFADEQGDVFVNIAHNTPSYKDYRFYSVRIGGCGSGHQVPSKIRSLLLQLAAEFEKYKDCKYENEALLIEMKDKNYKL